MGRYSYITCEGQEANINSLCYTMALSYAAPCWLISALQWLIKMSLEAY